MNSAESTSTWGATLAGAALAFWLPGVLHAAQPPADADPGVTSRATHAQADCAALSGQLVGNIVLSATTMQAKSDMPAYCRVTGTIAPSLNFEIRFPKIWNGKLYYGGGGGYNGFIPPPVAAPLRQGYVEVASDSGHQGDGMSAAFVLNDELAARLFGSEAIPEVMSIALKVVAKAYGVPPVRSYFEGCSTGGREGLMAVQHNPALFDGVIARAPAFNWAGFNGAFHRIAEALSVPGAEFNAAKISLLARHVRQACDHLDGVIDGIVANPAACTTRRVNLAALRCSSGKDNGELCLSDAQLAVVNQWITDVKFQGSNTYVAKGYHLTGNEDDPMNFGVWVSGNGDLKAAGQYVMQDTAIKYYLAKDESADSLAYGPWDKNPAALDAMAKLNDATDPDIRPFIRHGGKLIVWQGGADAALSVNSTIEYMKQMRQAVGAKNAEQSTRLYIAPGVNHCEGGVGPDHVDLLSALDHWISRGAEPGTLMAQKLDGGGKVLRALPLCRYPQYPRYTGPKHDAAAINASSNYVCANP